MKLFVKILFLFFSFLFYSGCACTSAEQKSSEQKPAELKAVQTIPENIVQKTNSIIISRTGTEFFRNYIRLNTEKSREIPDAYYLSYNFQMPGKDYINEEITFIVDKQGRLKPEFEISGIPKCTADTAGCRFDITEEKAIELAKQAGLKPGIKDWEASFEWDSSHNEYIWLIRSTYSESMGSNGKRGTGEKVLIDPNSGEVLLKTEWKVF